MLHFVDSYYKQFSVQISQISNSYRIFPTVSLTTCNFDIAAQTFWLDYGLGIEEIYFRNGILRKAEFEEIIRWTPNLRVLKIETNSIFATWKILGTYSERVFTFENCHHISLAKNNFINRKIFDYIVSKAPNLRELDLSYCLAKMSGRERTELLDHLIFYLKGYGETIKKLYLHHTQTDDFFLQQLSEVKCMRLTALSLTFNGCVTNPKYGLINLLHVQNGIEELHLAESYVEENVLMEISKSLKNLRVLNLRKCSHVTDYSLIPLSKCEFLESLDLTSCDLVTDQGIHDALMVGTPKKNLHELKLALLSNFTERIFMQLGTKFHGQITYLDLGGSTNLADDMLQTIFWHFPKVTYLNIDSCCKISDYGLTGKFQNQVYFSINHLKGLKTFRMQNCYKITDNALIDSFQFNQLKEVFMARTHFGREGIEALVRNCPAIEVLDLGEVDGVDDDVVETITKCLPRLTTLKLNGNVTDFFPPI
jgi:F-box/leucine-rich repeat protein 9